MEIQLLNGDLEKGQMICQHGKWKRQEKWWTLRVHWSKGGVGGGVAAKIIGVMGIIKHLN